MYQYQPTQQQQQQQQQQQGPYPGQPHNNYQIPQSQQSAPQYGYQPPTLDYQQAPAQPQEMTYHMGHQPVSNYQPQYMQGPPQPQPMMISHPQASHYSSMGPSPQYTNPQPQYTSPQNTYKPLQPQYPSFPDQNTSYVPSAPSQLSSTAMSYSPPHLSPNFSPNQQPKNGRTNGDVDSAPQGLISLNLTGLANSFPSPPPSQSSLLSSKNNSRHTALVRVQGNSSTKSGSNPTIPDVLPMPKNSNTKATVKTSSSLVRIPPRPTTPSMPATNIFTETSALDFTMDKGDTHHVNSSVLARINALKISHPGYDDNKVNMAYRKAIAALVELQDNIQKEHKSDCKNIVKKLNKGDLQALDEYKPLLKKAYMMKLRTERIIYDEWHSTERGLFQKYLEKAMARVGKNYKARPGEFEEVIQRMDKERKEMEQKQMKQMKIFVDVSEQLIKECML